MSDEKIFCGSGKEKFGGALVEISVCLSDLPKEHIFEYNGKKYIKLKVRKMREEKNGKTHYIEVDTWRPERGTERREQQESSGSNYQQRDTTPVQSSQQPDETDDLPF